MEETLAELELRLIIDSIADNGHNGAEHDAILRAVFQAARDNGTHFNREKYVFNATSIAYSRHRSTTGSTIPDQK